MPRIEGAVGQVEFEHRWLPRLAPHLPIAVPEPLALGEPGDGYPWPWAINRWIDGENPSEDTIDLEQLATDLGKFVGGLRTVDVTGAPRGPRARSLQRKDIAVREWTAMAREVIDARAVIDAWEEALAVPEWNGPSVWTHGDLLAGNVLVTGGRLSAVIDFGAAGIGDPACDALPAWTMLTAETRKTFRAVAGFDDATWARGRGWALTFVSGLIYYRETNPVLAEVGRRAITEVLADLAE